jgi:hypothetical protein
MPVVGIQEGWAGKDGITAAGICGDVSNAEEGRIPL